LREKRDGALFRNCHDRIARQLINGNQEKALPLWRPSSCSSSNWLFQIGFVRFPLLQLGIPVVDKYAMLSFIPVVSQNRPLSKFPDFFLFLGIWLVGLRDRVQEFAALCLASCFGVRSIMSSGRLGGARTRAVSLGDRRPRKRRGLSCPSNRLLV